MEYNSHETEDIILKFEERAGEGAFLWKVKRELNWV